MIEEITIDETPTEVQLSVEPPVAQLEDAQLADESSLPIVSSVAAAEEPTSKAAVGTFEGAQTLAMSASSTKADIEVANRDESSRDGRNEDRTKKQEEKLKK